MQKHMHARADKATTQSSFFNQALESCDLFDLLPFAEWRVLWVGAITASDSILSNKN
jgi:hypothetical protein